MSGCDCSRCQTEGCVANTYCPCCLKAERDVLRAQIERVRELCEQTTVSVSIGCRCYTDECSGTCGAGRPLSWHLNPAAVFAALDGDSDE